MGSERVSGAVRRAAVFLGQGAREWVVSLELTAVVVWFLLGPILAVVAAPAIALGVEPPLAFGIAFLVSGTAFSIMGAGKIAEGKRIQTPISEGRMPPVRVVEQEFYSVLHQAAAYFVASGIFLAVGGVITGSSVGG